MHFTGDLHAVTAANNLLAAVIGRFNLFGVWILQLSKTQVFFQKSKKKLKIMELTGKLHRVNETETFKREGKDDFNKRNRKY